MYITIGDLVVRLAYYDGNGTHHTIRSRVIDINHDIVTVLNPDKTITEHGRSNLWNRVGVPHVDCFTHAPLFGALAAIHILNDFPSQRYYSETLLEQAWGLVDQDEVIFEKFDQIVERITGRHCHLCTDCSTVAWADDGQTLPGGDFVCEACFDKDYFTCCRCGDATENGDGNTVNGEANWCDRCVNNYAYWCEDCEEYSTDEHDHNETCGCEAPVQHFFFPANGAGTIHEDERFTVELPAGTITTEGMQAIASLVYMEMAQDHRVIDVVHGLDPIWQAKRGNFPRRLSTNLYKAHGIKLPPGLLSEVGNLARQHTSDASAWDIEFTRDLNQSADDFCNGESCWWSSHAQSRCAFKNWGGVGLRTFDPGERLWILGRAWVQPLNEYLAPTHNTINAHAYIVYNGYGNLDGYTAARIVGYLTSRTYRKVSFSCDQEYINGSTGYFVADEATCAETTSVNLDYDPHDYRDANSHKILEGVS